VWCVCVCVCVCVCKTLRFSLNNSNVLLKYAKLDKVNLIYNDQVSQQHWLNYPHSAYSTTNAGKLFFQLNDMATYKKADQLLL